MRVWQCSNSVRLALVVALAGGWGLTPAPSACAQELVSDEVLGSEVSTQQNGLGGELAAQPDGLSSEVPIASPEILQLDELPQPATTVGDWVAQIEASLVQITGVRVETTEAGLQIVLDTAEGTLATPTTQTVGNALIADIPNAVLALPEGGAFEQFGPAEGIALVSVTNEPGDTVRVAITGTDAPPVGEVTATGLAVTLGEAVIGAEDEAIQVVVTGEQDDGYRVPSTSTATRTDTPLRDIPQSIQVIPQEVLRDQQARNQTEVLRNVPGVQGGPTRESAIGFTVRGFSSNTLINGLRDASFGVASFDPANIERVEFLGGPSSVLYGQGALGGIINYVTKQPLSTPYYSLEAAAGNFNFYRGALDLSGPLNDSRTVLYRLNLAARTTDSFVDFYNEQQYLVAPVLTWQISDRTNLTLEAEYLARIKPGGNQALPAEGTIFPNPNGRIPRNRSTAEEGTDDSFYAIRVGYNLEHQFSENWQIRNAVRFSRVEGERNLLANTNLEADNRTLNRISLTVDDDNGQFWNTDTYVVGNFTTGSIRHQLVAGFNFARQESDFFTTVRSASPMDLFNPRYGQLSVGDITGRFSNPSSQNVLGIYVQDQVTLADNLKLLLGLRFDTFNGTTEDRIANTRQETSGNAFSPRVGIVYQPIEPISLYASYSQAFDPVTGTTFEGEVFQPERGTQYEVGIKADLNDRLSATLAFYDLTRSNVVTADTRPNVPPFFSIQTGEQRSRGVELNVAGEILPGWNIIAGYAYTDARITEDNGLPIGNRLTRAPENSFNLWTTYEIQQGSLQGLGFGLGFFFVGETQGDLDNTFQLPSYLTTDAAIFYRRDRFRAGLNVKNLFDVDYFQASAGRSNIFYGEPLTVQATISLEF